jgi:hypothetical protein
VTRWSPSDLAADPAGPPARPDAAAHPARQRSTNTAASAAAVTIGAITYTCGVLSLAAQPSASCRSRASGQHHAVRSPRTSSAGLGSAARLRNDTSCPRPRRPGDDDVGAAAVCELADLVHRVDVPGVDRHVGRDEAGGSASRYVDQEHRVARRR